MGLQKHALKLAIMAASIGSIVGCQPISDWNRKPVVETRLQTYDGIVIKDEFEKCMNEAGQREVAVSENKDPSGYLAVARVYESCLNIRQSEQYASFDDRFKVSALSYVNYFKAGDLQAATNMSRRIERDFPAHDLIFDDGSSFKDSIAALELGDAFDRRSSYQLNARPELEDELTRLSDWSKQ